MTDSRRCRDLSDDELESLIRRLPGRGPSSDLRARVLSHGLRAGRRRSRAPRPVLAFGALILLLVADLLVLNLQNAGLTAGVGIPAAVVTARAPSREDEHLAWLQEIGMSGLDLRVAHLSADSGAGPHTRAELLRSLLTPRNGG